MGLARQVPVPGLAERRPGPGRRVAEKLVEAGARDDSRPWVARVQVTASRPNAELNSSSCDAPVSGWIATVIPFVWPCHESTVDATRSCSVRPCFSRSRSTASVASSTAWLRVARTATSGSSGSSPGDHARRLAGRGAGVVVARLSRARSPPSNSSSSRSLDEVASAAGRRRAPRPPSRPSTSSSAGTPVATSLHTVRRDAGHPPRRHRPVARRGDAVELAPLGVERAPERQLCRPPAARPPAARPTRCASSPSKSVGHAR